MALAFVTFLGGCAGGDQDAYRIGLLTDCVGIYRTLEDAELSGAQLPLIARGAELVGSRPGDGITTARVADRPVEIVRGCTETGEFTTMFEQVRRLVERELVQAVVGGALGIDALGLRQVAHLYPDVTFVALPNGAREATLRRHPPNLYRVAGDHGQVVAGLGTYAYRDLGWRNAAVVSLNWDAGWGSTAAFVAEFCSLGGTVTSQNRLDVIDPSGGDADRVPTGVDGVAVLTTPFFGTQRGLVRRLAARFGSDRILLGPSVLGEPAAARAANGAIGASRYPPNDDPEMAAYLTSYRSAFPGLPAELAGNELVIATRNAVEALLQSLESVDGNLRELETALLGSPVRMDENGQAIVSARLVRVSGESTLQPIRTIRDVDQSIGGLLDPQHRPGAFDEPCRSATPPPWAR